MIRKPADALVMKLFDIKGEVENVIQDYMNEYADYGWDSTAEELRGICAGLEAVTVLLKYARISEKEQRR